MSAYHYSCRPFASFPLRAVFLFCQQFPQADDGRGHYAPGEKIAVVYQVDKFPTEPVQRLYGFPAVHPRHAVGHAVGVVEHVVRGWFVMFHFSSPPCASSFTSA